MVTNRRLNSKRNIIFGGLQKLTVILLPFLLRTVMLYTLGEQYLGISSLFTSILSVLNLAELGFGTAITYSMYKPIAENDNGKICALLNLYKTIYRIIGVIVLVIGLTLMPFLPKLISGTYSNDINIYLLYFIYLVNTVFSYTLFAYKSSLLIAFQRNDINSIVGMYLNVLLNIIQIVMLIVYKNYYFYIIFRPIFTIINNITIAIVTDRLLPAYNCKGKLDKQTILDIRKRVVALVVQKFGDVINTSFDSIIISAFLGLTTVAIYSNYYYILNSVGCLIGIVYTAVIPIIGNSIATDPVDKNYIDFITFSFLNQWTITVGTACLLCLYQPFMCFWAGKTLMFPNATVYLFTIFFYFWLVRYNVITYKDAAGIWHEDMIRPVVAAGFNLLLNIILSKIIGVNGVIISTILGTFVISLPWETHVLFKNYFKRSTSEYYIGLIKHTFISLLTCVICFLICGMLPKYGVTWILIKCIISVLVSNICLLMFYFRTKNFKNAIEFCVRFIR